MNAKQHSKKSSGSKNDTPFLEWLIGGIGVALLVTCVAFLIYEGATNGEEPGPVIATVLEVHHAGDIHVVTFKIRNGGTQTLSNLHVEAQLRDGNRDIERASTVIDYLPGHSSQEGGFYFKHDPRGLRVDIQPGGYQKP
jgi:uncharacterized protein (TIGR02588 family)